LTDNKGSEYERLVSQIERDPRADLVDLGFILLKMGSDAASRISQGLQHVVRRARETGHLADFSASVTADTGLTVHASYLPPREAMDRLVGHVLVRKYRTRASAWFGIGLDPRNGSLVFGYNVEEKWTPDPKMDELSRGFPIGGNFDFAKGTVRSRKIERNDPCPCNSGKKYKHCHLRSES
jgi:hypothetical protein